MADIFLLGGHVLSVKMDHQDFDILLDGFCKSKERKHE
jgi:hypothetical protein